ERMTFDLIVLDIRMPVVAGLTFHRHLGAPPKHEHLPVVMLTASDDMDDELQAMSGGAVSYIVKPAHRETLVKHVSDALQKTKPAP
ncbi:MAG: response regulator, partial [Actinomycetota bacterium]